MLHVLGIMAFCISVCVSSFIWSWRKCRLKFFGVIPVTDIIRGTMCVFCCFIIIIIIIIILCILYYYYYIMLLFFMITISFLIISLIKECLPTSIQFFIFKI